MANERTSSVIAQFSAMGNGRRSLIRKALDSSIGAGESAFSPLVAQKLEKVITNVVTRLSPELAVIKTEYAPQKFHEFNRLTALPKPNGFMGEGAATPTHQSFYTRDKVDLKVVRRKGGVTNFLQDASKGYIDAAAAEMENHLQSHAYDIITALLWGHAKANKYGIDGLDALIETNRENKALGGEVPQSLAFLDDMIDRNIEKQGASHNKCFLMSPKMQSYVSRLLTNVRLNQGNAGTATVEIAGGWRLETYRNIPILPESSFGSNKRKMGAVSALSGTTNYFRVSVITYDGESEASDVIQGGSAGGVSLNWAAEDGAFYYRVYAGATEATLKLVAVIPAQTYDGIGTYQAEVAGVVFNGNPLLPNQPLTLVAPAGLTAITNPTVSDKLASDVPLVATGGVVPECVALWDLDKYQGLGKVPYTNQGGDRFNGLVTIEPLAKTDDFMSFLIRTYFALCPSWEATSVMTRGLRTA
jgi:hypothetical protein